MLDFLQLYLLKLLGILQLSLPNLVHKEQNGAQQDEEAAEADCVLDGVVAVGGGDG